MENDNKLPLDPNTELSINTVKARTLRGIVILTGRGFFLQILGLIAVGFLAAYLGAYEWGVFAIVNAVINFLNYFSDVGLAAALIQKKEHPSEVDLRTTFLVQEVLVLIIIGIMVALGPFFTHKFSLTHDGVILYYAMAVSFLISSFKSIPSILLERKLDFIKLTIPQILEQTVYYIVLVILAVKGQGLMSFTVAVVVRDIVGVTALYILQPWRPGFAFSRKTLSGLFKFGIPYQVNTLLAALKDDGKDILIGSILGPVGFGYLAFAIKFARYPLTFFMDTVTRVMFPAFSRMQHAKADLERSVTRSIFFTCFLVFPSLVGIVVLAPVIFSVIPQYAKWSPALLALAFISINFGFAAATTQLTNLLNAIGKIKVTFYLMIMWTVLTWVLIPVLAIKFGFNGAALGYSIVGASSVVAIMVTKRYVNFSIIDSMLKPLIGATLMGVVLLVLRGILPNTLYSVGILVLMGGLVYAAILLSMVGVTLIEDAKKLLKQYLTASLLILTGTIAWSITMIKSGLIYSFGMGFWGANGHDGIWHIALINSLSKGSFVMPIFSGENIKNYHLGFDLIVSFVHNLTKISVINLYFQILPVIFALLIGISCYFFVLALTKSKSASLWATFFVYFGGEISWFFGRGESTFWSQQSISTLINPPFALSLIFIFSGLYFLLKRKSLLTILFFGILFETKAYAGVLILGSLFLAGIWEYFREKKFDILKIFLGSSVITLILFLILNRGTENVFIFSPFWFLQTLFNLDRFSIPKFASAIANYNLAHNWFKLLPAYMVAFVIFWVGNMWTRLFKEFEVIRWLRHPKTISSLDVFITSMIIGGAVIPMLFVQKGTPWNTIQFFYYSLIFSAILAGVALKNLKNKFLILVIILLTIPTTIITLKDVYIPGRPPAKVSNEELSALDFLSKQEDGVVLTYPFNRDAANAAVNNPPRPLYLYDSTAYVSALSNHSVFLEDQVNLDITNFPWQERRDVVFNNFLNTLDQTQARKFLKDNSIKYVYWVKPQRAKLGETQLGLINIFENSKVNIFKVE